jgi:hypothetical protein
MITAEKNKNISDRVYKVGKGNEVEYEGIYNFNDRNEELGKYKVLAVENNKDNGMQAIAVAPVESNGEVGII